MAVPRTKAKPKTSMQQVTVDKSITYISKRVFPNFVAMVMEGMLDEINWWCKTEHNIELTKEQKYELVKLVSARLDKYATWGRDGVINPFEMRTNFEKTFGVDFSKLYI